MQYSININEPTTPGINDVPPQFEVEMTNGDAIRATRRDPFGFWYLSLKSGGPLPQEFSGAYTERDFARRAIDRYLLSRNIEEGPSTRPAIKYKPGYGPGGKKIKDEEQLLA